MPGGDRRPGQETTRVVAVSATGGLGGPVVSLLTMIRTSSRCRFSVAGPFNDALQERLRQVPTVDAVLPLPAARRRTALRLPLLAMHVIALLARRRNRRAVVLANGLTEAAVAAPAALLLRRPLVVWVHNWELPVVARVAGPLLRSRLLDVRWMAVSSVAAQVCAPVRGRRACALVLNPLEPDEVLGRPREADPAPALVRIGFLGSARSYKGADLLPSIMRSTESHTSCAIEWRIHTGLGAVPDLAAELTPRPGVEVVGHVYPPRLAYEQLDLVVAPSRQESFGRVVAEAMFNGLSVVASDIPAFRELLDVTADAALFPIEDTQRAGAMLARLVEDPALRRAVGQANRAASQRFAADIAVQAFEAELLAAAGEPTSSTEARQAQEAA